MKKFFKTLKWNAGIFIVRIGYIIRNSDNPNNSFRWHIGVLILRIGYAIRGEVPQKTWAGNHV